jgi:hypothetical protein
MPGINDPSDPKKQPFPAGIPGDGEAGSNGAGGEVLGGRGGLSVPWHEFLSRQGGTSSASFGWGGENQSVLNIDVHFTEVKDAVNLLLGYPTIDYSPEPLLPRKLRRHLPMRNPFWQTHRATRITEMRPLRFTGKEIGPYSSFSDYEQMRLTVLFQVPTYAMLSDGYLQDHKGGDESQRWVYWKRKTSLSQVMREGDSVKWGPNAPEGLRGNSLTVPFGMVLHKQSLTCIWRCVPEKFFQTAAGRATGLDACGGRVNAAPFRGYPRGSVLLESYDEDDISIPVDPTLVSLLQWEPPRVYDLSIHLAVFDPPLGPGETEHGWNCAPSTKSGLYYLLTTSDGSSTPYLYEDFGKIFSAAT